MEDCIHIKGITYLREDGIVSDIIKENENLRKEVARLAIESVKREKELARLEADIEYLKEYKFMYDDLNR